MIHFTRPVVEPMFHAFHLLDLFSDNVDLKIDVIQREFGWKWPNLQVSQYGHHYSQLVGIALFVGLVAVFALKVSP